MRSYTFILFAQALSVGAQTLPCYRDNVNGARTMSGASTRSDTMTNAACKTYCNDLGYAYSGTEYSRECFCSNTLPAETSTQCNMDCAGAAGTTCGGPDALSVSVSTALLSQNTESGALLASWTNAGCYGDNYPVRVLSGSSLVSSTMTLEKCLSFCNNGGFSLAGVEYSSECYCANSISTDGSTYGVSGKEGCNFPCAGNNNQACGGNNVINLYSKFPTVHSVNPGGLFSPTPLTSKSYDYKGCYADSQASRTLTNFKGFMASVEQCVTKCSADGFTLAGLEYHGECFCDSTIHGSQTTLANVKCNLECTGTPSEHCGGANAIAIYEGSPVAGVVVPQNVNGYQYVDTFVDEPRVLPTRHYLQDVTVASCISACSGSGFPYAGVEYGNECWCGTAVPSGTTGGLQASMPCAGDSTQYCGGSNALQVYHGTPVPVVLSTGFTNGVCVKGSTSGARTLSVSIPTTATMTITECATACASYTYYGVEYGNECYCGNEFTVGTAFSSSCNMPCAGDSQQKCGGPDALNIYTHS